MQTQAEWIAEAARRLGAVSETPRLDAELILAHATRQPRAGLLARLREPVSESLTLTRMLARRARGEPLAYLFGTWEFFSLEFEIEPPALVPRPETEHLVETVLEFAGDRGVDVLDLCTGTGCVAVAIAVHAPHARVVAADIETRYAALAARNAARHGVGSRLKCLQSDLFDRVEQPETFDVICANPPYVEAGSWDSLSPTVREFEDPRALLAGDDGLDVVRAIVRAAAGRLRPGGLLALEIGQGQADAVRMLLADADYEDVRFRRDLAGIERIAVANSPATERNGTVGVKETGGEEHLSMGRHGVGRVREDGPGDGEA